MKKNRKVKLKDLLKKITKENKNVDEDFLNMKPVGKEIL